MFLKWALRVPVVWWYSITQLLLRISPLLSLKEIKNQGVSCNVRLGPLDYRIQLFPEWIKQNDACLGGRGKNMRAFSERCSVLRYKINNLLCTRNHQTDVSSLRVGCHTKWFRWETGEAGQAVELLTPLTTGCLADLQSWKVVLVGRNVERGCGTG